MSEASEELPPAGARALVLLPFDTAERAVTFANMVISQMPGAAPPIVAHGTAYAWKSEETGETGQVIEIFPESNFETFVGQQGNRHVVLQRTTKEEPDEVSTGGSVDHHAGDPGAGEGGGVPPVGA